MNRVCSVYGVFGVDSKTLRNYLMVFQHAHFVLCPICLHGATATTAAVTSLLSLSSDQFIGFYERREEFDVTFILFFYV